MIRHISSPKKIRKYVCLKPLQKSGAIVFKYENVPDGVTDYNEGIELFVGIAAVLESSNEYREVISILGLNLLYFISYF